MNSVEILASLIQEGYALEATKQTSTSLVPRNTPIQVIRVGTHQSTIEAAPYGGSSNTPTLLTQTVVDEEKYERWRDRTEQFLEDNNLKKFIKERAMTQQGNYHQFEPQFEQLKLLKRLDDFLDSKLNFKTDNIHQYLLDIFASNNKENLCFLELLSNIFGYSDVNEVFLEMKEDKLLNVSRGGYMDGWRLQTPTDSQYLTMKGRKALEKTRKGVIPKKEIGTAISAEASAFLSTKFDIENLNTLGLSQLYADALNQRLFEMQITQPAIHYQPPQIESLVCLKISNNRLWNLRLSIQVLG
ncbi:MAG: hypothetical protein FWF24_02660 [Alphaproteobacteria bacterium]|nr:hypothetical protein [Alphaproteobacteria bacterium]